MKAIAAYFENGAVTFRRHEAPDVPLAGRDLRVRVEAVSMNPVDYKVASRLGPDSKGPQVLGYDAAGVVEEVGPEARNYRIGDEVYYAGSIARSGTNCDRHVVDERIVGRKPKSLSYAEAAALPLTALTAYEALFHRLGIAKGEGSRGKRVLLVGAAGGVGSIAVQLLKRLTATTVVGTATRPESVQWIQALGADAVIRHDAPFAEQMTGAPDYIFCMQATEQHFAAMATAIAPQGRIASIVETKAPVDLSLLMQKSASFHWELMFTRSLFTTPDIAEQQAILNEVSQLIDAGKLRTTVGKNLGAMNPESIAQAHEQLRSGKTIGKVVLERLA